MIFHHMPSRPLDRHPTSHQLKHFQISHFTRGTQIFDIAGREPKAAHWVSFFGQNISKLVLPKYFGGHCYLYSNWVMYTLYTPLPLAEMIKTPTLSKSSEPLRCYVCDSGDDKECGSEDSKVL